MSAASTESVIFIRPPCPQDKCAFTGDRSAAVNRLQEAAERRTIALMLNTPSRARLRDQPRESLATHVIEPPKRREVDRMKVENEQAILDRTVLRLPMRLLLCIALFACQDEQSTDSRQSLAGPDTGHGEAADLGPEPVDPSVVTVVRIEPEGHLFTAAGQRVGLTVTAFNGLGDVVEHEAAAVSWLSSAPEVACRPST